MPAIYRSLINFGDGRPSSCSVVACLALAVAGVATSSLHPRRTPGRRATAINGGRAARWPARNRETRPTLPVRFFRVSASISIARREPKSHACASRSCASATHRCVAHRNTAHLAHSAGSTGAGRGWSNYLDAIRPFVVQPWTRSTPDSHFSLLQFQRVAYGDCGSYPGQAR